MRKGRIGTVVALAAGLLLVASSAMATHVVTLSFSPENPTAGDVVQIKVESTTATAPQIQLLWCVSTADPTVPLPMAACNTEGTGDWTQLAETEPPNGVFELVYAFNTTNYPGMVIGFQGWQEPGPNANHTASLVSRDLTIGALTSGDRHQGCNGIENALTKVKPGGNAKNKLDAIAAKFHCDIL